VLVRQRHWQVAGRLENRGLYLSKIKLEGEKQKVKFGNKNLKIQIKIRYKKVL